MVLSLSAYLNPSNSLLRKLSKPQCSSANGQDHGARILVQCICVEAFLRPASNGYSNPLDVQNTLLDHNTPCFLLHQGASNLTPSIRYK